MVAALIDESGEAAQRGKMDGRQPGTDLMAQITAVKPSPRIAIGDHPLAPEAVITKLRAAYLAGVKRCYQAELTRRSDASGEVTVSFQVNATGRAIEPKVSSFASPLDACVLGLVRSWRFSIADRRPADIDTRYELRLVLTPG